MRGPLPRDAASAAGEDMATLEKLDVVRGRPAVRVLCTAERSVTGCMGWNKSKMHAWHPRARQVGFNLAWDRFWRLTAAVVSLPTELSRGIHKLLASESS